jgi:hypothetical protein
MLQTGDESSAHSFGQEAFAFAEAALGAPPSGISSTPNSTGSVESAAPESAT